jgi:LytS/YehU family sensor histidine kinase
VRLQSAKSSGDSLIVLSEDEPAVFNLEDGQMLTIEVVDEKGIRSYPIELKTELPFWQQVEFLWALLLLLAIAIYFVFRFSVNRSRKNAVIEAKLAHLERSALQAQMNPHFIFNSLNSIQSYIANNENHKANRFLAKFSRLIRSMLNHSRSQKVTLHEEIESLRLYLELEKMRFKDKFEYDIVIDEDIDPSDIELPPLLIQPYLENAIIHGLAQKRSMGKINLFYIMDGNYLLATVTDNGVGYETSKAQKTTGQASLHKSVGMTVTQKRLEMLDEGNRDRKVHIKEVKDRFGEVLGTKVEVKIRVH